MTRSTRIPALARALAISLAAVLPAACYYAPYPYAYSVPASFDRSFNAVVGAMGDNGLSILMEDRPAGRVVGRRGGIDLTGTIASQADGTVRVEFTSSGATAQDPNLINRVTQSYNARMGR